jgi:hypothetical protein
VELLMLPDASPTPKLLLTVAFSGDLFDLDPDRAADELRQVGYEVSRLPKKYWARLPHPLDDFLEAVIPEPDDPKLVGVLWDEVEAIVSQRGGCCYECGQMEPDHVPFVDLFTKPDERAYPVN